MYGSNTLHSLHTVYFFTHTHKTQKNIQNISRKYFSKIDNYILCNITVGTLKM